MIIKVVTKEWLASEGLRWWEIQQMFNASCGWAKDDTSSKVWELIDNGYRLLELGGNTCSSFGWG
jgi:hypothetical protein